MIIPFLPFQPADPVYYDIVDSPVGRILLTGDERALTGLYLLDAGEHSASVDPGWIRRPGGFGTASAQLGDYFAFQRQWRRRHPTLQAVVVPRGLHFPMCDNPELVAAELVRRLKASASDVPGPDG